MSSVSVKKCMKEFNYQVEIYFKCKSQNIEDLLNRNLSLLIDFHDLSEAETNESCSFYINVHRLISQLDTKSVSFWQCISLLEQTIKYEAIRDAILHKYQFLAVLIQHLDNIENEVKQIQFLTLLQNLTYGIKIKAEESYLILLVKLLVKNVMVCENKKINTLSLSILVNIASNKVGAHILVQCLDNVKIFTDKIKSYGILAYKLIFIMGDEITSLKIEDLISFLRLIFKEVNTAIRTWDVPLMSNIVQFLTDALYYAISASIVEKIELKNDVEDMLKNLSSQIEMADNIENTIKQKNQFNCVSLIFKFLNIILDFDPSLELLYPVVIDFGNKWIQNEYASVNVLNVFNNICTKVIHNENNAILTEIVKNIPPIVASLSETKKQKQDKIISLLKILGVVVCHLNSQEIILNCATEDFFKEILSKVLLTNVEEINFTEFSHKDIIMFITCIDTMVEFSNVLPLIWFGITFNLFKLKQIHFVLARGLLCGNEEICNTIFKLSKLHNFNAEVSKIIAKQGPLIAANAFLPTEKNNNFFSIHKIESLHANRTQENQIDSLINHITTIIQADGINNVLTTDLIRVFEKKIHMCNKTEELLQNKVKQLENEITHQSQLIALLSTEVSSYQTNIFSLNLTQERLQAQRISIENELEMTGTTLMTYKKIINDESVKSKIHQQNLNDKIKKLELLRNESEKLEKHLKEKDEVITKLKEDSKEIAKNIEEKEKILKNMTNEINELKLDNNKFKTLIQVQQKELTEKNNKIVALEVEVDDLEKTRQQILNLMQCKQPTKRKL